MRLSEQYLNDIEKDLNRAGWLYGRYKSGKITCFPGARRGNKAYAAKEQKCIDAVISELNSMSGTPFFFTFTAPYNNGCLEDIFDSWFIVKKRWRAFLQWARRNNFYTHIQVYEAHENGGCHLHIIMHHKEKMDIRIPLCDIPRIIILRRLNKKSTKYKHTQHLLKILQLTRKIKKAWNIGHAEISFAEDKNKDSSTVNYLCKELGRGSQVEDALTRMKQGKATATDKKKLWAHFISKKLKLRRWSTSRNLKARPLDIKINNSINIQNNDYIIDVIPIPVPIRRANSFKKEITILYPGSDEYKFVNNLFMTVSQEKENIDLLVTDALSE